MAFGVTASLAGLVGLAAPAIASDRQSVWLSSDSSAPDMLDLFRHPELWARARERVGVFKFVPPHVDPRIAAGRNSYAALKDSGAFALLRQWGIKVAVEEGAVKEWDCTGTKQAAPATIGHIASIAAAGAALQVVAMDEPLVSGRGPCALSIEIAARTAAYAGQVRRARRLRLPPSRSRLGISSPIRFAMRALMTLGSSAWVCRPSASRHQYSLSMPDPSGTTCDASRVLS
jgi:hypothetical protein